MDKKSFYFVVGRSSCPFCVKAKNLLEERKISCYFRDLEEDRDLLMEYCNKFDWNTVPMIFYVQNEEQYEFIGGFSDLKNRIGE
jgi:glutaredoxin